MVDWILCNIPFLIAAIFLIVKICLGVKNGAVKELCGFISLIIASVLVLLIGLAVRNYLSQARVVFVIMIILILLLLVVYAVFNVIFTGLKIVSKLPGVNLVNKLLGIPVAIAEVVLMIWTVYIICAVYDAGIISKAVNECAQSNVIMHFLYKYNYLLIFIGRAFDSVKQVDFWGLVGL